MSLEAWGDEPWGAEDEPDIERLLGKGFRSADDMTKAAHDVIDERLRQRDVEGWTPEHDDAHDKGEMLAAACGYAQRHADADMFGADFAVNKLPAPARWPWGLSWWKPKDRRRDLVRAAALLLAEIERLDRLEDKAGS